MSNLGSHKLLISTTEIKNRCEFGCGDKFPFKCTDECPNNLLSDSLSQQKINNNGMIIESHFNNL